MAEDQEDDLGVIGPRRASTVLAEIFGVLVDAEYLNGKTLFRDALCDRFGLSQLEAEEMCDELERGGVLEFVHSESGDGWHIHLPDEEAARRRD